MTFGGFCGEDGDRAPQWVADLSLHRVAVPPELPQAQTLKQAEVRSAEHEEKLLRLVQLPFSLFLCGHLHLLQALLIPVFFLVLPRDLKVKMYTLPSQNISQHLKVNYPVC